MESNKDLQFKAAHQASSLGFKAENPQNLYEFEEKDATKLKSSVAIFRILNQTQDKTPLSFTEEKKIQLILKITQQMEKDIDGVAFDEFLFAQKDAMLLPQGQEFWPCLLVLKAEKKIDYQLQELEFDDGLKIQWRTITHNWDESQQIPKFQQFFDPQSYKLDPEGRNLILSEEEPKTDQCEEQKVSDIEDLSDSQEDFLPDETMELADDRQNLEKKEREAKMLEDEISALNQMLEMELDSYKSEVADYETEKAQMIHYQDQVERYKEEGRWLDQRIEEWKKKNEELDQKQDS